MFECKIVSCSGGCQEHAFGSAVVGVAATHFDDGDKSGGNVSQGWLCLRTSQHRSGFDAHGVLDGENSKRLLLPSWQL